MGNMLQNAFAKRFEIAPKSAVFSAVIVANALVWYLYSGRLLTVAFEGVNTSAALAVVDIVRAGNIVGTIVAALFGVFFVSRISRRVTFLQYWMLAGAIISLIPVVVDVTNVVVGLSFFTLLGVYFGLGMPVCFAYFAASTENQNRSRTGALIVLLSFFIVIAISVIDVAGVALNAVILALCQVAGLAALKLVKAEEKEVAPKNQTTYLAIIKNKQFLLYFVPWIVFALINYVALGSVSKLSGDLFRVSGTIEHFLSCIIVVVFGFFADRFGRKKLVVFGFALLGIGYASLGLLQESALQTFGWWFYTVVDGIAWGVFYAIFVMTIWGDLAQGKKRRKILRIRLDSVFCFVTY
jgi:MFS family permease